MKKYAGLAARETPTIIRGLPELHYPHRLNAAAHLLDWAAGEGRAHIAYFAKDEAISFGKVRREAHRYAAALRRAGLGRGDTVMLRFEDSPELIYALLAVWIVGAVAVPTYVQLRADGLVYRARDCGA
jgi:acyl-coenzyme A synthetase/AMP-(fatty) acid ligase